MDEIPGNPFRGEDAPERAYRHLQRYHGVDPGEASDRLHAIKQRHGLGAAERVVIEKTGGVLPESSGELLGSLTMRST